MKEIQTKSNKIIAIEVPEEANTFELISQGYYLRYKTGKFNHIKGADDTKEIDLRNNYIAPKFEITCKLSELTDEYCEKFVESIRKKGQFVEYISYYKDYPSNTFTHGTAWNSFISLLQSGGIDTNKEWLIIKVL